MCVRCSLVLSRGRSMELIPGMGLDWREDQMEFGYGYASDRGTAWGWSMVEEGMPCR